jgi:hypothetical protein
MAKILTQEEANELLDLLKKCVKEYVTFPNKKQKECFDVIADDIRDKKVCLLLILIEQTNLQMIKFHFLLDVSKMIYCC